MNFNELGAAWSPRLLGLLRIVTGILFTEHGAQKLLGFPPSDHGSPELLSLAILLIALWAAARGRYRWLGLLAMVYTLSYTAFHAFVGLCRAALGLPIEGLMCIPPLDEEPAMHFALLAKIAARLGLQELSMGMSGDFEKAIAFGATYVRVGTAVFGARETKDD